MIKKLSISLISIFIALTVAGQTEKGTLKKANELIKEKKYQSAYKLLNDFDPKNGNVDVVLLKEEIALNYFVTSIMHQIFSLKDLEKNEDIMDYRGKEGSYEMYMLEIDKVLDSLIKIYPDNCKLYNGLGNYYYEVQMKYGGKWLKGDKELFKLIETNYKKAIEGKCADYLTYYVMGYINIEQGKYREGIPYFLKSIELNKKNADSYYNAAYAYFNIEDKENALKYAKSSIDLYSDSYYKSDAARMTGQIYFELNDETNALTNFELANKIDTGNYYNIKPLLYLYVKSGNEKAKQTTKQFFDLDPTNPKIDSDLEDIYYNNKKENELAAFYKEELTAFKNDETVSGNLNFYLGNIYLDIDKKLAKEYFLKAKDIFSKIYDKDHPVFKAIEDGIAEAEK